MQTVLDISIPVIAILIMVALGLELTLEDFRNVARSPKLMTAAMAGQILVLPPAAIGLAQLLALKPHVTTGLLLIASCPAGGMSNYYTYLAGARTALSVVLTAGSCLAALATMPLAWAVYELYLGHTIGFAVPVSKLMAQLFVMLVFPVLLGMLIRHYRLTFATRHETIFRRMSLAGLAALFGWRHARQLAVVATVTTALMALLGLVEQPPVGLPQLVCALAAVGVTVAATAAARGGDAPADVVPGDATTAEA